MVSGAPGAWRWVVPIVVGASILLTPHPEFAPRAWRLLALFGATVSALIARPLPSGPMVLLAMTSGIVLHLFSVDVALSAFSNSTIWLIVTAFLFSRGFVDTRLGERIAYSIVKRLGANPLGLGYGIVLADLTMAPLTPSNSARAGGILFPVVLNVARAFGSEPGATAGRIGTFLMSALFHGDIVVCAMFLTAVAPNPLVAALAQQTGGVSITWLSWAAAAAGPGVVSLVVVPYAVWRLCPPEIDDTRAARRLATEQLAAMGPLSRRERMMIAIFGLVFVLWLTGEWHGYSPTAVALVGLTLLVVTRVVEWSTVLAETGAWDSLLWFGGLVMLAAQLQDAGFPATFASLVSRLVQGWPWWWAVVALLVVYYYAHYAFATLAAHVTAMFPAFFAAALALGAPPLMAALAFGFFSSLNASITHYGTGPAPIIFGAGYVTQGQWWRVGFLISLIHLTIWLPIGLLWWKLIGLW